jgi:hypothetical protein
MAKIYSQASRVLVWLGEDDEYVDMAFDTFEQFSWVVKVRVWQYCSEKLRRPLPEITENMVSSLIRSENIRSSNPFTNYKDVPGLLKAFPTISVDFSTTDPVRMANENFGKDSLAAYMLSDQQKLSKYHGWRERIKALGGVFIGRSYWSRLWVVQELISATKSVLLCGKRQVDYTMVHCILLALLQ